MEFDQFEVAPAHRGRQQQPASQTLHARQGEAKLKGAF